MDAKLLEDIGFSVGRGQRRREALAETLTQLTEFMRRLDGTLRRADGNALRTLVEDQLELVEGTLRDAVERLGGVGDALDDSLELLERVRWGAGG